VSESVPARVPVLVTARLTLRDWRESDRGPFAALNADPRVMEHFPSTLDRAGSDALAARLETRLREQGWGLWAVDLDGAFIGFTGLARPSFEAPFMPAIEIGWRLAPHAWGHGYATEAAIAAAAHAFDVLGLDELVSFTTVRNVPSRRVMERIGMTHDEVDDFDHPNLVGHPQQRHVLYRLSRSRFAGSRATAAASR
jgi:RimJ/RimL family protein N-acetyltransferase